MVENNKVLLNKKEIIQGEDTKEWCWVDFDDLNKKDLAPNIKPTLKHFGFLK